MRVCGLKDVWEQRERGRRNGLCQLRDCVLQGGGERGGEHC